MIANSAFLAAMILMGLVFWALDALAFLAPYKHAILRVDGRVIFDTLLVIFFNLFALIYTVTRAFFLKDTGRKLAHVDHQLETGDTIARDLSARLTSEE